MLKVFKSLGAKNLGLHVFLKFKKNSKDKTFFMLAVFDKLNRVFYKSNGGDFLKCGNFWYFLFIIFIFFGFKISQKFFDKKTFSLAMR